VIVRPDTLQPCPDGEVGEIWLSGPSVARGYWNQPEHTRKTFAGKTNSDLTGDYLRTGDLGFLETGQLYVTGRLKDLIIIRGSNHYPQDIERSVEACHASIRPGAVAAFSVLMGFEERLILALELDPTRGNEGPTDSPSCQEIAQAIVAAVGRDFELDVQVIEFIGKGSVSKTSSGKLQRSLVRNAFLNKTLDLVYEWRRERDGPSDPVARGFSPALGPQRRTVSEAVMEPLPENIRTWLIDKVACHLGLSAADFDPERPFSDYGLASKDAVELSGDLGDWLGSRFSPALLWKYPSVETLSQHLSPGTETTRVSALIK
jgi:acyl carrier protein